MAEKPSLYVRIVGRLAEVAIVLTLVAWCIQSIACAIKPFRP